MTWTLTAQLCVLIFFTALSISFIVAAASPRRDN